MKKSKLRIVEKGGWRFTIYDVPSHYGYGATVCSCILGKVGYLCGLSVVLSPDDNPYSSPFSRCKALFGPRGIVLGYEKIT